MGNVVSITTAVGPSRYDEVKAAIRAYSSSPEGTAEFLEAAEELILFIEDAFAPAHSRADERARAALIRLTWDDEKIRGALLAAMLRDLDPPEDADAA
jgi:hypothetical protein